MEEKVLIKSTQYNVKKLFKILVIIGAIISALMFICTFIGLFEYYSPIFKPTYEYHEECYANGETGSSAFVENGKIYFSFRYSCEYTDRCSICELFMRYGSLGKLGYVLKIFTKPVGFDIYDLGYAFRDFFDFSASHHRNSESLFIKNIFPFFILTLIGGLIYLGLHSYDLTVTDKRVFGRVAWGKRVDLPVDSVSAISSVSLWKGISVSTSSGKIKFLLMKNANEIYNILNNLLIERQQMKNETSSARESNSSVADELKKYKELLDGGIISEAEFEAKKKQLLGL